MIDTFDSHKWNAFRLHPEKMKKKSTEGIRALSIPIYENRNTNGESTQKKTWV